MKKADRLFYVNRHSCFLLLTGAVKGCVYNALREGLENRGCNVLGMNGEADHVHILFEAPPNERLTELANVLKTRSARITWKRYPRELKKNLLG